MTQSLKFATKVFIITNSWAQNQTKQDKSTPGILEQCKVNHEVVHPPCLQRVSFGDVGGRCQNRNTVTLGVVMLVCHPIPWEAETGELSFWGQPGQHDETLSLTHMMALLVPVLTKVAKSQEVMTVDFYSQLLDTNLPLSRNSVYHICFGHGSPQDWGAQTENKSCNRPVRNEDIRKRYFTSQPTKLFKYWTTKKREFSQASHAGRRKRCLLGCELVWKRFHTFLTTGQLSDGAKVQSLRVPPWTEPHLAGQGLSVHILSTLLKLSSPLRVPLGPFS